MHRSSSNTRVSDEFFFSTNSSSAAAATGAMSSSPNPKPSINTDLDHLPTYNPISHAPKKEKYYHRFRSAENSVHLIPLLLLLCAIILWYFSTPVDLVNKSDSIVAKVENSLINSGVDHDHGKSSLESNLEQEEVDSANQSTEDVDQVNRSTDSALPNIIR